MVTVSGFYVALQFLRTMVAAIRGLSRMIYVAPTVSSIVSVGGKDVVAYFRHAVTDVARRLEHHRETTNEKVNQLALAHESLINGVTMLIVAIVILGGITVWESLK